MPYRRLGEPWPSLGGLGLGTPIGGGASTPTYAEILRDTYGASEIWPLVDISAGTTISAFINSSRNGTLTGWDLQNAAGPVPGTLAPYSDGANDTGALWTASLQTLVATLTTTSKFSVFMWGKTSAWTDGQSRRLFMIFGSSPATEYITIRKNTTNNQLVWEAGINGKGRSATYAYSDTGWFSAGFSWDQTTGGAFPCYLNGSNVVNMAGPVTDMWQDSTLVAARTSVMCDNNSTPSAIWDGWGAYFAILIGDTWSDADFLGMHNAAATAGAD